MLTGSLLASYVAAVLVNAVRITIAIWLAGHSNAVSGLSSGQIHRVEGISVYFGGLVLLYEITRQIDRGAAIAGNKP